MVPAKTDPRWKQIASDPEQFKSKVLALPTKMLFSGLKIKSRSHSVDQLVNIAHEFFTKNEKIVAQDIKAIFG